MAQNSDSRFEVGRANICRQTPLEPVEQSVVNVFQFFGRTVASKNYLFSKLAESVERVEEDVLSLFLAGKELDVVDNQHVYRTVERLKLVAPVVLNGIDKLDGKTVTRSIED